MQFQRGGNAPCGSGYPKWGVRCCSGGGLSAEFEVNLSGLIDRVLNAPCDRASDFALYTQASILAPDGKCKPFDAEGNGYIYQFQSQSRSDSIPQLLAWRRSGRCGNQTA